MPDSASTTVSIWVKAGSRNEDPEQAGIAHFLEHMVFKGGQKYKSAEEVSQAVDRLGAEINAGTSKEWTNYYIRVRNEGVIDACGILSDILVTPALKDVDIDRERGVIFSEMDMYEDIPMRKVESVYEKLIFGGVLGEDIIGRKDTLSKFGKVDFSTFLSNYYTSQNMLVVVCGGVDEEEARSVCEKHFNQIASRSVKHTYDLNHNEFRSSIINKPVEQAHIVLGVRSGNLKSKSKYAEELVASILGEGMSSRLWTEVREKRGLAYVVRTSTNRYMDLGSMDTYMGVDPKNAKESIKVVVSSLSELGSGTLKITEEELFRAKEMVKGHMALSLEGSRALSEHYAHDELMLGESTTPKQDMEMYDRISLDEVNEMASNLFGNNKYYLSVVGPFKDASVFDNIW